MLTASIYDNPVALPGLPGPGSESTKSNIDLVNSKAMVTWLVDWLPMRLIGVGSAGTASYVVYTAITLQIVGRNVTQALCGCGVIRPALWWGDYGNPAERELDCPFGVMALLMASCPLVVYPSFPKIFGHLRKRIDDNSVTSPNVDDLNASGNGGLALLCSNCPSAEVSVKVWLQRIRVFMVLGSTFATLVMVLESVFHVMPGFGASSYTYTSTPERLHAWMIFFVQPFATVCICGIGTAWILSLLLSTWLVEQSCTTIQKHVRGGAFTTDAQWRDHVLTPVKTLATSTIPTLSECWGANFALVLIAFVGILLCAICVVISPQANDPAHSGPVSGARANMVLVVVPLALLSVPARVSSRFNSLKHDVSLLRFEYNADVNRRVDEFESALKTNTVGFKIVGVMVTSERVKGLVFSGIAAYGTLTSLLAKVDDFSDGGVAGSTSR